MAEFTGERIIPGKVDPDLLNEHLARYSFAARLARGKRLLDAGCGTGYGSAELAKTALTVTGADVSAEAVGFAREHYRLPNLRFEQASATALPHPDASFDLVVAFEVIEHLEDWRSFLLEVRRVLVPGGQFIVSTPNRLYYAEARAREGPNPFHVHEFEFAEFRDELSTVFPHISLFLENHVEGVVFQPVERSETAEVRVDGGDVTSSESHFFVAVCAHRPQTGNPTFVYVPRAGNVLRERERHIALLEDEVRTKTGWLEKAQQEHQELLALHRTQREELNAATEWGQNLDRELDAVKARVVQVQNELAQAQAEAARVVAQLQQDVRTSTEWAQDAERRLEEKTQELSRCVDLLHEAEKLVEERTNWALALQSEAESLKGSLSMVEASRWVKLGRRVGLGPALPAR